MLIRWATPHTQSLLHHFWPGVKEHELYVFAHAFFHCRVTKYTGEEATAVAPFAEFGGTY
jgi:hypothetical protein